MVLAGCVPQGEPTAAPTASVSPSPTATATAEPTPSAEPTVEPGATPVDLACDQVITPQQMFDFNSIYSAVDEAPEAGSPAGQALALDGVACRWVNTSSGVAIDASVAQPAPAQLQALRDAATGETGYGFFDGGVAQAFADPYWVTVASPDFTVAEDAAPLVGAVVGNLP
jgi:hypothetical protein